MSTEPDPVVRIPANPTEAYRLGYRTAWKSVPDWCHRSAFRITIYVLFWLHFVVDAAHLIARWT